MGRMIKNTVFKSASYAMRAPNGTSTITPDAPVVGQIQYRADTNKLSYYGSNSSGVFGWYSIAREGAAELVRDNFTGNSVQTDFTMSISYNSGQESQVLVFVGTVVQIPTTNYEFNGSTTIHFLAAPSTGAAISVVHNLGSTISA